MKRSHRQFVETLESRLLMAIVSVLNTNDSGAGSLRAAIVAAADGDTVDLSAVSGTITLQSSLTFVDKNLTLAGPQSGTLTLDGNSAVEILNISSNGTPTTVSISDLTFANGSAENGGAIQTDGALMVTNCIFNNNSITGSSPDGGVDDLAIGGAIEAGGDVTITGSTFTGNSAVGNGGTNGSAYGGAIAADAMNISNSTFSGNSASSNGGTNGETLGGALYANGALTISDSTFSNNTNSATGGTNGSAYGGVAYARGAVQISGSTFESNSSSGNGGVNGSGQGGALEAQAGGDISNSTFTGNSALASGGTNSFGSAGAMLVEGTLTLTNCTIVGNSVSGGFQNAGGVLLDGMSGPTGTLYNNIIAGNTATDAPDLQADTSFGGTVTSSHNLIGSNDGNSFVDGTNGDQVGASGSPLDPLVNALADNGGPTETMSLKANSPAVDAGDDNNAETTDQRGYTRSGTSDIGAFELNGAAPVTNHAPVFASGTTNSTLTNVAISWTISATDADNDTLTFSATTLPAWLTLTDNQDGTATLSGTPANTDAGANAVGVRVSDGTDHIDTPLEIDVSLPRWQLTQSGLLTVAGDSTDNNINVWLRDDQVRVTRDGIIKNYAANLVTSVEIYGQDGDDNLGVNTRSIPAYMLGGAGNDTLIGGSENDILTGGAGKDYLDGGSGDDRLNGGTGSDTLFGGDGNDRLYGGDGADQIHGDEGDDSIYDQDSTRDSVWGGDGSNHFTLDNIDQIMDGV